jgi:hypothetical protein
VLAAQEPAPELFAQLRPVPAAEKAVTALSPSLGFVITLYDVCPGEGYSVRRQGLEPRTR